MPRTPRNWPRYLVGTFVSICAIHAGILISGRAQTMGIYDRDYMRRRDSESRDSTGTFAMKGMVLAILIVGGALSLTHRARVELKERQREKDSELEYVRLIEKDIERLSLKLEPSTKILNPVNVNTATGDELDAIPYVSPYLAKGIIANRPYDAVEDLDRVPGIGIQTLGRIRPYVTVK